ncbi:class I SAM-dependent methyltransferase [Metabacillus idriensis]|uniref:Class I SAM-dependent methyltransferase n=1 Tax=Metabacillus idriensis TaxID=324768 RepID=A0A6I2MEJ4_9BACI|nr:class I SAM-dependent methyltransferase [Metabacillus idriensis]MCM3598082.1 class I SAM-dependent methyltransferase [Metabacillus idriensis]MRX56169.1 class I SAM-dependent methyltransferase [Metabacillus idriensis]
MDTLYNNLRILPIGPLNHYLQKRYNDLPWVRKLGLDHIKLKGDFLLMHAWKPGCIIISQNQAEQLKSVIKNGETETSGLPQMPTEWLNSEKQEPIIEGILTKVLVPGLFEILLNEDLDIKSQQARRLRTILEGLSENVPIFPAIQNEYELRNFLVDIESQKPKTVVEIGTASGGVFYCLSQLADEEALLVSIDYPGGPYGGGQDENEIKLYSSFGKPKQEFAFIRDRSFHHSTKQDLIRILGDRKIDLLFIDGDHSYGGVKSDFNMYKDLVAPEGVIAFHDINSRPESWGRGFDVGLFWDELKLNHGSTKEIIDPKGCKEPAYLNQDHNNLSYGIGKISI